MAKATHIKLSHGAGGREMQRLIGELVLRHMGGKVGEVPLEMLDDSAVIDDVVFTIDSHTVKPLFFPGGDMGTLAVAGTINDIAVMGARPVALALGFVVEEGLPIVELDRITASVAATSEAAGVPIVTGDTKVMERGSVDKLVVTTAGIGRRWPALEHNLEVVREHREYRHNWLTDSGIAGGDAIIVSGHVGDHGVALLSFREGYGFESEVQSDVAPLNKMIASALEVGGITAMKDPTRGGLANTLNEWSEKSGVGILVDEERIPIRKPVKAACEMLGIDPLEIGNEGKAVIAVVPGMAEQVLEALRRTPEGRDAQLIGEARGDVRGVAMETVVGGRRILEPPIGDPVPRIC